MNTLHFGTSGEDVQSLQDLLNKNLKPSPFLRVDGIFGIRTEDAVRRYQASVGIGIDGIAGVHTLTALQRNIKPIVTRPAISIDLSKAPWIAVAMREMGQTEQPHGRHNPRILEYHASTKYPPTTDEDSWCSSFVNWCLRETGVVGTNSATAISWLQWGQMCGPRVGAITVIDELNAVPAPGRSGYHVGFWQEDIGTHFTLLGGNQSGTVKSSLYPRKKWVPVSHRWPSK